MNKILLSFCFVSLITQAAWAGGPGTTSANFLKAGQGVRAVSMGETYIALGDGLDTLYWNPAGLVQLGTPTVSFTHNIWLQDISSEYLAYGTPLGPLGALGAGLNILHTSPIEQTLENPDGTYGGTGGQVSAMNIAFIGTYSQKLSRILPTPDPFFKNVLIGASLRIVSESIDTTSIFGGGLDLGAIWRQTEEIKPQELAQASGSDSGAAPMAAIRDRGWRAGFVAQNLGVTTDQLMPINFRAGLGYVAQEVLSPTGRATVGVDALIPIDNDIKFTLGAEYANVSPNTEFAARVGYKIGNEIKDLDAMAGMTAGAGVAINAGLLRYQVDYAFVPYGELGATHRVQLSLGFMPQEKPVRKATKSPVARENLPTSMVVPKVAAAPASTAPVSASKTEAAGNTVSAFSLEPATAPQAPANEIEKLNKSLQGFLMRVKSGMLAPIDFTKENNLTSGAQKTLNKLGPVLERTEEGVVTITGFAGKDLKAAEDRAKAAARYLTMNFRLDPDRLRTKAGDPAGQPKNSAIGLEATDK